MSESKNKLLELGFCDKPHGIKGGLSFKLFNLDDSSLEIGSEITLFPKNNMSTISSGGEKFEISSISFGNKVIAYLKGVTDRNLVEDLIPFKIFVAEDSLNDLDEGEFYLKDLYQLDIRVEGIKSVGKVLGFYDNNAQLVLEIEIDGDRFDIPFVDQFILEKNFEEKFLLISLPEEF